MQGLATIKRLRKSGSVQTALKRRSQHRKEIEALQYLLHELGFDGPLQWEKYGADGDYGGCTTRAVQAFVRQAGIKSESAKSGTRVTSDIADALIRSADEKIAAQRALSLRKHQVSLGRTVLGRGAEGPEVVELQIRLAGFRGTVWDGDYGPGTELQVKSFQRDFMGMAEPTGVADEVTFKKLRQFAKTNPVRFQKVRCPCGECSGFGNGQFANVYRDGRPHVEAYHNREYPGVHKAILHAFRAARFYGGHTEDAPLIMSSGYRCWINNNRRGRLSTNHMGKALDCDFTLQAGEDKRDDQNRCDRFRGVLVEKGNFQLGWAAPNRKSLEPSNIAPTWIHMDVRQFAPRYLDDRFFVTSVAALDSFDIEG